MKKNMEKKVQQGGFTLLEMMVVIMIIGLLAAVVAPDLLSSKGKANQKKAAVDIVSLESALDMFYLDHNRYPSQQEGLEALINSLGNQQVSGYIKRMPVDPWGNEYQYLNPGVMGRIDIFTQGEDQQPGGEGMAADIGNWNVNNF